MEQTLLYYYNTSLNKTLLKVRQVTLGTICEITLQLQLENVCLKSSDFLVGDVTNKILGCHVIPLKLQQIFHAIFPTVKKIFIATGIQTLE